MKENQIGHVRPDGHVAIAAHIFADAKLLLKGYVWTPKAEIKVLGGKTVEHTVALARFSDGEEFHVPMASAVYVSRQDAGYAYEAYACRLNAKLAKSQSNTRVGRYSEMARMASVKSSFYARA